MIKLFGQQWKDAPIVFLDTETTGTKPGIDRAVQVGIVRFEKGVEVGSFSSLVNPGRDIPPEATAIHGIKTEDVDGSPSVQSIFLLADVQRLLRDAQPGAYNAIFDRAMVPPFGPDPFWPWLDPLTFVRFVDRYERGKGRHKLDAACKRHGIELGEKAHGALADARAAGQLFYKLAATIERDQPIGTLGTGTLGNVLFWQRKVEEWFRFFSWLAKQPPKEEPDAAA